MEISALINAKARRSAEIWELEAGNRLLGLECDGWLDISRNLPQTVKVFDENSSPTGREYCQWLAVILCHLQAKYSRIDLLAKWILAVIYSLFLHIAFTTWIILHCTFLATVSRILMNLK